MQGGGVVVVWGQGGRGVVGQGGRVVVKGLINIFKTQTNRNKNYLICDTFYLTCFSFVRSYLKKIWLQYKIYFAPAEHGLKKLLVTKKTNKNIFKQ